MQGLGGRNWAADGIGRKGAAVREKEKAKLYI